MLTGDVAKRLDCGPDYVRRLERTGRLRARRTAGGVRIFDSSDVERLAADRQLRAATRSRQ